MYKGAVDALIRLTSKDARSGACRITKVSGADATMLNGIEYCFVEVTFHGGEQYAIWAHGQEAIELHGEAIRIRNELQAFPHAAMAILA